MPNHRLREHHRIRFERDQALCGMVIGATGVFGFAIAGPLAVAGRDVGI